ncbi:DUF3231 family protein [Metabacillus sp. SLBN-84]
MKKQLASSEIGNLWMTYQQKTMFARMLEHFLHTQENEKIKQQLQSFYDQETAYIQEISGIFQAEKIVTPVGFNDSDVKPDTPRLYDEYFDILFLRIMMKVTIGLNALHLSMTYRSDMSDLFMRMPAASQQTYTDTTQFCLMKAF